MHKLSEITDLVSKDVPQPALSRILHALQGIRYGAVEIVIHDGRIVQIERKEKLRLDVPGEKQVSLKR